MSKETFYEPLFMNPVHTDEDIGKVSRDEYNDFIDGWLDTTLKADNIAEVALVAVTRTVDGEVSFEDLKVNVVDGVYEPTLRGVCLPMGGAAHVVFDNAVKELSINIDELDDGDAIEVSGSHFNLFFQVGE